MFFWRSLNIPHVVQTQHAAPSLGIVLVTLLGIISQNKPALAEAAKSTLEERVRASTYRIEDASRNGTCGVLVSDGTERVFIVSTLHGLRTLSGERACCFRYTEHRCGCFNPSGLVFDVVLREGTRELWFSSAGSGIAIIPTTLHPILFHESPVVGSGDLAHPGGSVSDASPADRLQVFGFSITPEGCIDVEKHTANTTMISAADADTIQKVSERIAVRLTDLLRADYDVDVSNCTFCGSPCFNSKCIIGFHADSLGPMKGSVLIPASDVKSLFLSITEESLRNIQKAALAISRLRESPRIRDCVTTVPPKSTLHSSKERNFEDIVQQTTFRIDDFRMKGGTGFVMEGLDGGPVLITNQHVLDACRGEKVNLHRFRKCKCGCYSPDFTYAIHIRDGTISLWTRSAASDVAAIRIESSPDSLKQELNTQLFIDTESMIFLRDLPTRFTATPIAGRVWGFPKDSRDCILADHQGNFFKSLTLETNQLHRDDLHMVSFGPADWLIADYYIPDTIGGYSGSPVFLGDKLIGIHQGRNDDLHQSVIVPADYIIEVLNLLYSERDNKQRDR